MFERVKRSIKGTARMSRTERVFGKEYVAVRVEERRSRRSEPRPREANRDAARSSGPIEFEPERRLVRVDRSCSRVR